MALGAEFIAKMADPSAKNWSIIDDTDTLLKFHFAPTRSTVTVADGLPDFRENYQDQLHSARMWNLSLGYIAAIHGRSQEIFSVLTAFNEYFSTPENRKFLYGISSADHATSVRIRTMILALHQPDSDAYRGLAMKVISNDCAWAMEPGSLAQNNHGMMLATAVLHACAVAHGSIEDEGAVRASMTEFLIKLLSSVFDEDGMCNENSLGYHEFYLKHLRDLGDFAAADGDLPALSEYIGTVLPMVKNALSKAVWPEGHIPPTGDSVFYPTNYPSIEGLHHFSHSGLLVRKDGSTYFSFVCGDRGKVHKHLDDTSITLRKNGNDLLIDGGFLNYDWTNQRQVCLASQRGHSGLFFRSLDEYRPALFWNKFPNYKASLSVAQTSDTNAIVFSGEYETDVGGFKASRTVTMLSLTDFAIADKFSSPTGEPAIQRFVIPGTASIKIDGRTVTVANGSSKLLLVTPEGGAIQLFSGVDGDQPKGWMCHERGNIKPAYVVEVTPRSGADSMITYVSVSAS